MTTQPATPAWLTLANGSPLFTQQTLVGVAADEYGSTGAADPTLFGNEASYPNAPSVGGDVVGTALVNYSATTSGITDPGDSYAFVLKGNPDARRARPAVRRLPARDVGHRPDDRDSGRRRRSVAAAPGGTAGSKVIVITQQDGFYVYDFSAGASPSLTLEANTPTATLTAQESGGDVQLGGNPAATCTTIIGTSGCNNTYAGSYKFGVPAGLPALAVIRGATGQGVVRHGRGTCTVDVRDRL